MAIVEGVACEKEVLRKIRSVKDGGESLWAHKRTCMALRKGDNTAHNQMDAVNSDTIEHYFKWKP